jgi:hypothetical protein
MMELLVFVAVLITLIALADRFGVDSRDTLRSPEAELAALGFVSEAERVNSAGSMYGRESEAEKW